MVDKSTFCFTVHVQVPSVWSSRWDGPEDPAMYLRTVVAKALALSSWLQKSELGSLLGDEPLDLSELFNPATFLNALCQQTGRYSYHRRSYGCSSCHTNNLESYNSILDTETNSSALIAKDVHTHT